MTEHIKEQRHFLQLLIQTTPAQRKALLQTITKQQLRVLSEITLNILKFKIKLTTSQKSYLKRHKRVLYLLGNRKTGYQQKREAIQNKQRLVYTLVKIASAYLQSEIQ